MRTPSIRKRLERLEKALPHGTNLRYRNATIEILSYDTVGERHLVMISPPDATTCRFQERLGPGPQLADFGEFDLVLWATHDELLA